MDRVPEVVANRLARGERLGSAVWEARTIQCSFRGCRRQAVCHRPLAPVGFEDTAPTATKHSNLLRLRVIEPAGASCQCIGAKSSTLWETKLPSSSCGVHAPLARSRMGRTEWGFRVGGVTMAAVASPPMTDRVSQSLARQFCRLLEGGTVRELTVSAMPRATPLPAAAIAIEYVKLFTSARPRRGRALTGHPPQLCQAQTLTRQFRFSILPLRIQETRGRCFQRERPFRGGTI